MSTESRAQAVLANLPSVRPWQEDFYRDLHSHPELSALSHATARRGRPATPIRAAGARSRARRTARGIRCPARRRRDGDKSATD